MFQVSILPFFLIIFYLLSRIWFILNIFSYSRVYNASFVSENSKEDMKKGI